MEKSLEDQLWDAQQTSAKLTAIIVDAARMLSEAGRPDLGLLIKEAAKIKVIGELTVSLPPTSNCAACHGPIHMQDGHWAHTPVNGAVPRHMAIAPRLK